MRHAAAEFVLSGVALIIPVAAQWRVVIKWYQEQWVSLQTAHVVRDIVGATPADLQRTLHTLHHVEANYKSAWRAHQAVLNEMASSDELLPY
jgi:hypothetical protein